MHFTAAVTALVAGFLAASVAAEPAQNLLPRATLSSSACASSYSVVSSSRPTATNAALSSWLAAHTTTTANVPQSLESGYCTYDRSRASWIQSTVKPFVSKCSNYLGSADASSFSSFEAEFSTTASWCSSVTHNAAPARETGFIAPGMMAAAGLVAAVL